MKQSNIRRLASLTVLCAITGGAAAQESPWFVRMGATSVQHQSDADIAVGGAAVPGSGLNLSDASALSAEFGYWFTPSVALRGLVGFPLLKTRAEGRGTLATFGELGEITYAPLVVTATYSFDLGSVKPYVGAGMAYVGITDTKDGALKNLKVDSGFGSVLQVGVDIPIDKTWGVFLDYRKLYWKTKATGTVPAFGGAPAQVDLNPSPSAVTIGVSMRF